MGMAFAPPVPIDVDDPELAKRKERAGMLVLGAVAAIACLVSLLTAVPVVRAFAASALVVIGSALTPIDPLDGAKIAVPKIVDWLITILLGVCTALTAVSLL